MESLQLFRLKVFPSMHNQHLTKSELLRQRIEATPTAELRSGYQWHIGNIEEVDECSVYFRVGRTTKTTLERFKDGRFVDTEVEAAPSTGVLLDFELELCAIAAKSKLAPTVMGIAEKLNRLLNEGDPAPEYPIEFEIGDLKNPRGLIESLERAYQIESFWLTVTRPNLFDTEKDFIEPTEHTVEAIRAEKAKTTFSGTDMDKDKTADLARSVGASGDDAGATVRFSEGGPRERVAFSKSGVILTAEDLEDLRDRARAMREMREQYLEIRGHTN